MRYLYGFLLFVFTPLTIFCQQLSTSAEIIIRFQPKVDAYDFVDNYQSASRQALPFSIKRQVSKLLNIYTLAYSGTPKDGRQIIRSLSNNRDVLKVGYDTPLTYRNVTPDDEFFDDQWNLDRIGLPQVWKETTGGKTANGDQIVIAVLEKGIELDHPDILENIWRNEAEIANNGRDDDNNGYIDDFFGLNLDDLTDNHPVLSHGTQVSGIIGARTNNGTGMAGINWDAKILFLSGVDLSSEVIEAYEYLYNLRKKYNETNGAEGAFIVVNNNSFGWDNTRPEELRMGVELCEMYDIMGEVGILSVGAGPNNDVDVELVGDTPTNCTSNFFLGVTSTDESDEKARDGGFGEISIDIGAPGENIRATDTGQDYGTFSGTSFATPHVTGALGLMYALPCEQLADDAKSNPKQTAAFLKNVLLIATDPIRGLESRTVSGGRLNVFNAMTNLQSYCGTMAGDQLAITNLYPNPTTGLITLEFETTDFEPYQLIISNNLGQIVFEKSIMPPRFATPVLEEDLSWLASGVYTVSLLRDEEQVSQRLIVAPSGR
ncbi:MAG: S8 family serine peptidase [Bacteroidota bacterium]